jgi:hypothetical protein
MGVPMHMNVESVTSFSPIFQENSLNPLNLFDSTDNRQNYFAGIRIQGPPDALDIVYDYLAKVKKQKQKTGQIENLYRELFPNTFSYAPYTPQVASSYPNFRHEPLSASPAYPAVNGIISTIYDSSQDPLQDKIFAFKGSVCSNCISCCIIPIYGFVDIGTVFSHEHVCKPAFSEEYKTLPTSSKALFLQFLHASLHYRVMHEYVKWSGNSLLLAAIKIEGVVESLTKKSLSLRKTTSESHWLLRVIRQQCTPLTEDELLQFLYLSENNNVNSFEIRFPEREELNGTYCLYVIKKSTTQY